MPEKLPQRGERNVEKDPLFSVFLCSEMHESVILQFSKKNVSKETNTCSIWCFSWTCEREKFALQLVLETVPGTFAW